MKKMQLMFLLIVSVSIGNAQTLTERTDLAYTSDQEDNLKQLNLIIPDHVDNPPLLLWIGGGAWTYVDRHQEMPLCRRIASEGIVVASVGHRLSPNYLNEPIREEGIQYPEHIKDVAKAFAWLLQRSEELGFDRERVYVGGFSSGAHLSAMLAINPEFLQAVGHQQGEVAGIIPIGGCFDVPHYRDVLVGGNPDYRWKHIEAVFGKTEEEQVAASPMNYLEHLQVPMLIMSDNQTHKYNRHFEDALLETEFEHYDMVHVRSKTHGDLWRDLGSGQSMYRDFIVRFIKGSS